MTALAALIVAAPVFWLAYEVRQLRLGRTDEGAVERWWVALARHRAMIERRRMPQRMDY